MHELEPGGIQVPPSRRGNGTSDRRSPRTRGESDHTMGRAFVKPPHLVHVLRVILIE